MMTQKPWYVKRKNRGMEPHHGAKVIVRTMQPAKTTIIVSRTAKAGINGGHRQPLVAISNSPR